MDSAAAGDKRHQPHFVSRLEIHQNVLVRDAGQYEVDRSYCHGGRLAHRWKQRLQSVKPVRRFMKQADVPYLATRCGCCPDERVEKRSRLCAFEDFNGISRMACARMQSEKRLIRFPPAIQQPDL